MFMIGQHRPGMPAFRTLLDCWTELGGNGCDRHKTDPASTELLLQGRTQISHNDIPFDKRITQESNAHRTVQLIPVLQRCKETFQPDMPYRIIFDMRTERIGSLNGIHHVIQRIA